MKEMKVVRFDNKKYLKLTFSGKVVSSISKVSSIFEANIFEEADANVLAKIFGGISIPVLSRFKVKNDADAEVLDAYGWGSHGVLWIHNGVKSLMSVANPERCQEIIDELYKIGGFKENSLKLVEVDTIEIQGGIAHA